MIVACKECGVDIERLTRRRLYCSSCADKRRKLSTKRSREARVNGETMAYRLNFPEKYAARMAVLNAVARGDLVRPSECSECKKPCKPDAHHDSYEPGRRLDVRWLCRKCHNWADRERRKSEPKKKKKYRPENFPHLGLSPRDRGRLGGMARARKTTARQRLEIAKKASAAAHGRHYEIPREGPDQVIVAR